MGVTDPNARPHPRLQRHPNFPVPRPEIQRSAPPPAPRRGPRYRPTGVFAAPLAPPTRTLARPTPTKRIQRKLPQAPMPSYPLLHHYTAAQQRTIVRGVQRAGNRVADRGAIQRPQALRPLERVRAQQEAAANQRYARGFGVTPQQAAVLRAVGNVRSQAQPRNLQSLLSDPGGFDLSSYLSSPQHNLLVAGYPGVRHMLENANQLSAVGRKYGADVGAILRHAGADVRGGRGTVGGVTPGFLRAPVGLSLGVAGAALPTLGRIAGGAGGDLVQFTLGAVPTVAMLGQQAVHDPGAALKTLVSGAIDPLKHPLDHPLFALAMLHGGIRGVSRTAGAVGRSPLSPAVVRRALSTERTPLQIAGPGNKRLLLYRHYSKDPLVKAVQVLFDRKLPKGAKVMDQHGRVVDARLTAESKLASMLGQDAAGQLRKFADHTADRANAVERANRAAITQELVKAMPTREHRGGRVGQAVGGYVDRMLHSQPHTSVHLPMRAYRPERDVVSLVHTGIIRNAKTFRSDLEKELGALQRVKEFANPQERAANLARQQTIQRVLADPRAMANAHRVVAAGRALAIRGRALTERAVRDGALTREQADRAPLFDYAIRHMGARHFTVEQHKALEREHFAREQAAHAIVHDAERVVRRAEQAIKENKPHLISAPHGENFLNRGEVNKRIEELNHQHAGLLREYNRLASQQRAMADFMNRLPAGRIREAFREHSYIPLSDEFRKADQAARDMHAEIAALQERVDAATRGDLITGQPDRPAGDITWLHGTEHAYDGLPDAYRRNNDLGVYLTSDPHYASGYAQNAADAEAPARRVVMAHVTPRKVLDTRFGKANPDEVANVIERLLKRADEEHAALRVRMRERLDESAAKKAAEGSPPHPPGFVEHHVEHAVVLYRHTRNVLEDALRELRDPNSPFRKQAAGEAPRSPAALRRWQELDKTMMRIAPSEITAAERNALPKGQSATAWGIHHQPTRQILRELGYDAVRKIDQHADSLVVVNESIMRAPGLPRPHPGKSTAHVQVGDHLEAQKFEANAQMHNVHVTRTFRKGDGMVAEVQGSRAAIDRLAAQHAHYTASNVLVLHHDPKAPGAAYTVREKDGSTVIYLESNPTDAYAEQLRAAHPDAQITETPGVGRMLTPESHAAFARDIRTVGNRTGDELARNLQSAREALAAAQRAHGVARERRIQVSGRHPELTKRHEAAQAAVARAKRRADHAAMEHARAEKARLKLTGAQSSRRGSRQAEAVGGRGLTRTAGERPSGRATPAEKAKLAAADARVAAAKAKRQAAEAQHREIKAKAEKVRKPDINAGLRRPDGTYLPNADIHAHMRENGIPFDKQGNPLVAYLPHTPDFNSRAAYHRAQALVRRDTVESGFQRTGRSLEQGTVGTSYDALAQHHLRMGITTGDGAIGQFDKMVREGATVRQDGKPFTNAEAEDYLANLSNHPDQPQLVKVRLFQGRFTPGQKATIQRIQSPGSFDPGAYGSLHDYVEKSFLERVAPKGDTPAWSTSGERNIGLVPKELVDRYQRHLTALGNRSPTGALLAQAFRTAVLPFSSKWLVGNVAEAVLRLAIIGANPADYIAGRRAVTQMKGRPARTIAGRQVLKEIIGLDATHAGLSNEILSSLLGGLFYGERGLTVHRDASYYESTRLKAPAEFIGGLAHTTLLREVGHEVARVPRTIFALNRWLERQSQYTALGRYVRRDIQEFTNSWLQTVRLQEKAIRESARGLYNTPAQADAARFMDETLGKYSRFSPRTRAFIQTVAPFLPWYLNSARFVFWTLPMKHPTKTAALMAAETTFGKDIKEQHKDLPPGELKSAVPSGGGWLDLARFTPMGAFTGLFGDPTKGYEHLTDPLLPQAQGIYNAMRGQDPFGRDLQVAKTPSNPKGKPTPGDVRTNIVNQALGSFIPGYSPLQRIAEHGETPYGNSSLLLGIHTKPNTSHGFSGLGRLTDPIRPVFLKAKPGGKPAGMSTREYELLLREARHEARSAPAANKREQELLLREARQAAGIAP